MDKIHQNLSTEERQQLEALLAKAKSAEHKSLEQVKEVGPTKSELADVQDEQKTDTTAIPSPEKQTETPQISASNVVDISPRSNLKMKTLLTKVLQGKESLENLDIKTVDDAADALDAVNDMENAA